jgi:dienelactone hydrolase
MPRPRTRNLSPWAYWRLRLDTIERDDPCPIDELDRFDAWRASAVRRLRDAIGPWPDSVPLDVETLAVDETANYRREHIVFDSEATMSVPAYLLVPHQRTAPGAAVLAIHGHGPGKSTVCGLDGPTEDYAHTLAERGFVVLAPDLRCFGERADWMPAGKYQCDWNLVCATMTGDTPLGQNVWDMQRALDVLAAHPLVDADRIAAAGFSYGATTALFLAALDERVRVTVVSGYLSSWRAAHTMPWNMCGSQVWRGLLGEFEHVDIASLIAPRALFVESGREDLIFPVEAATATVGALRRVYDHAGAGASLQHHVFEGEHQWSGDGVPEFLEQHL